MTYPAGKFVTGTLEIFRVKKARRPEEILEPTGDSDQFFTSFLVQDLSNLEKIEKICVKKARHDGVRRPRRAGRF